MKKQIVNFYTILLLLFSILIVSCKADDSDSSDLRIDVFPNYNNGIFDIMVNNYSEQTYQLLIFDPEGNKIYEKSGETYRQNRYSFELKKITNRTGVFYAVLKTPTSTIKTRIFVT
jgi:hypothetical protein